MMDLLVQIATAHKLAASSYTLQAIGERGRILPHQPNTPIGALDALEVFLLLPIIPTHTFLIRFLEFLILSFKLEQKALKVLMNGGNYLF